MTVPRTDVDPIIAAINRMDPIQAYIYSSWLSDALRRRRDEGVTAFNAKYTASRKKASIATKKRSSRVEDWCAVNLKPGDVIVVNGRSKYRLVDSINQNHLHSWKLDVSIHDERKINGGFYKSTSLVNFFLERKDSTYITNQMKDVIRIFRDGKFVSVNDIARKEIENAAAKSL